MAVSADYVMNIKDITYVSGDVDMTVTLGQYIVPVIPTAVDVSNSILSEVSVPAAFTSTGSALLCKPLTTKYIPVVGANSYVVTPSIANGFQHAMATTAFTISMSQQTSLINPNVATFIITGQYSWNGTVWYDASFQDYILVPPTIEYVAIPVTSSFFVPGTPSTGAVYARWKVFNQQTATDWGYDISYVNGMIDVFPRHSHTWVQTGQADDTAIGVNENNAVYDGTIPETITCTINGGAPFAITCAAPNYTGTANIKASLVTGANSIKFTSTVPCTVTPSATYLALPT